MRKLTLSLAILSLGGVLTSVHAEEAINYEQDILPFVRESCYKCHLPKHEDERGRLRKPKGGFVFTNKAALMEAEGEEGPEGYNKFIVPGEPEKSAMLQVTKTSIDADYHFPPEGKAPQWTPEQIALFEKWIAAGADFGDWEADKEIEADPAAWAASQ